MKQQAYWMRSQACMCATTLQRARGIGRVPHQPMLALMNWMSSKMIMSSQLAMAASTMTASHIMMGMGITSCR